MIQIQGYEILKDIGEHVQTSIYRARREDDQEPVILKALKLDYPTPEEFTRFQREFDLTRGIEGTGVIRAHKLMKRGHSLVMELEDSGGNSLQLLLAERRPSLKECLKIALNTALALSEVHAAKIIHKDINPSNIIYNPSSGQLSIIDFGIATQLQQEVQGMVNVNTLEGTLAYIAPEQTGRMNRSIDARSDLYSLGATFYELFTGRLPFETQDVLELVHCHLARQPDSPHTVCPELPEAVSAIILRLMAKNAEERYHSAAGTAYDLQRCLTQLQETGSIQPFPLGEKDFTPVFTLPQKLYGREQEIAELLEVFERVNRPGSDLPPELLLVSGYSGVGKSALVHEIHRPITAKRGTFLAGKFDQFHKDIPYYALRQALDEFMTLLLTASTDELEIWKTRLLKAVGDVGAVALDIAPRLELVIGPQPEVPQLGRQEAANRLIFVMRNIVKAMARSDHPLVLFLDDLQWADRTSLTLLQAILQDPSCRNLLMICAYRDNEVGPAHPFTQFVEELREGRTPVTSLNVQNLRAEDLDALVRDAFRCEQNVAKPLSRLLEQKTGGNAFFVTQLLATLSEEGLIVFDYAERIWVWDLPQIERYAVSANVAELMTQKLRKFDESARHLLTLAACLGNRFILDDVAMAAGEPTRTVLKRLWPAIQEGLILPMNQRYKLLLTDVEFEEKSQSLQVFEGDEAAEFRFLHDRVQQGAYELVSEEERQPLHRHIARRLLERVTPEEKEEQAFVIAHHFNCAHSILTEDDVPVAFSMNVRAGLKANASEAYLTASGFFRQAAALCDENCWDDDYATMLRFHTHWAEAEYAASHNEKAEEVFAAIFRHARSALDKAPAYRMKLATYTMSHQPQKGVESGRQALKELGDPFPETLTQEDVQVALRRIGVTLAEKTEEELLELPLMTDPTACAVMDVLRGILVCALYCDPLLATLTVVKQLELTFLHGNHPLSCWAYLVYGYTLSMFGDPGACTNYTSFGLRLAERLQSKQQRGLTLHSLYGSFEQYRSPLRSMLPLHLKSMPLLQESGERQFLGFAYLLYTLNHLYAGLSLPEVWQRWEEYTAPIEALNSPQNSLWFKAQKQMVATLQGKSEQPEQLRGTWFDVEVEMSGLYASQDFFLLGLVHCLQHLLALIFKKRSENLLGEIATTEQIMMGAGGKFGQVFGSAFLWHAALLLLRDYPEDEELRTDYRRKIDEFAADMKLASDLCAANFLHKHLLLQAEIARVDGNPLEAMRLYHEAAEHAREQEFLHEEALCYEAAAGFFQTAKLDELAEMYLKKAYHGYRQWGAVAKVTQLEKRWPHLLERTATSVKNATGTTFSHTSSGGAASFLDVTTMIKASQTLSQEVRVDRLLHRLMQLALENAGAQSGALLLKEEDRFLLQARISTDGDIQVLQRIPLTDEEQMDAESGNTSSQSYSPAIVEYVIRTQEHVVLTNAAQNSTFENDGYIRIRQPKSVLCLPFLQKGALGGVLYLENNLSTNVFTPERLELLNVLCSQAAISLENARLVEAMREQERLQREMELARQIQTAILPKEMHHDDLEIEAAMLPAEEVGGDYYDVLYDEEGGLWLGIGDVSGHGVTPGLIMMMAQTIKMTVVSSQSCSPKDAVNVVNKILFKNVHERLQADHFMTFCTLKYLGKGRFQHAGAHLDFIVHRRAADRCELIDTPGAWLNFIPDISHAIDNAEFTLDIGDTLVLYTDGLTEAHRPKGDILDIHRFVEFVRKHADKSPADMRDAILEETLAWCGHNRDDDMSLVIVRRMR